jgi:arylsulfatase A-like enzyme
MSGCGVIALAVWLGLAAGLLEVATRTLGRAIAPTGRLNMMSRHFIWVTPLANLIVFLTLGLVLAAAIRIWPRTGSWLTPRILLALAILPQLMVAGPNIFTEAWFILALGVAVRLVPLIKASPDRLRALLLWSLPALGGLVVVLAASIFAGDWVKERREEIRPFPPAGTPNVLLIVLDTVRQDRLSLYGYTRSTTPTLERLAMRGIRFNAARATAPWTLPSHASLFTGRWPHELGVDWRTPIRNNHLTLAEYLGTHGYATAGFVSNVQYCSYDTGLSRGFTYYEDYRLERLNLLCTASLVDEFYRTVFLVGARYQTGLFHFLEKHVTSWLSFQIRRDAQSMNRGFFEWLDRRRQSGRPFFAFINYLDAHAPYTPPQSATQQFGLKPQTDRELWIIDSSWSFIDKLALPPFYVNMARDRYDDCLAYLDKCLGELFDDLNRRGELDRTWILIMSDHGEGLGEHGLFEHGESLYASEIRVPLLIVPAASSRTAAVVSETVSLRQLPATVVDVLGLQAGAPFPGRSLASLWLSPSKNSSLQEGEVALSELPSPNPSNPNQGRSPTHRGSLMSLAEGRFVYIRNLGDGREELFDELDDPRELINLTPKEAMKPTLERLRARLDQAVPIPQLKASSR